MNALQRARKAAEQFADDPFRPCYHPAPPTGWMNDPNGLIWFQGKAHLFYQHYPYAPNWGRMHWGHMASRDLVRWEHLPVALAPDQPYERLLGCFSGSAIAIGETLNLLYTGVSTLGGQQQCLAASEDGVEFVKRKKPVIAKKQLPKGCGKYDFRDPKVFLRGGLFHCLVSAAAKRDGVRGRQIACYTSADLIHWEDRGAAFEDFGTDRGIFECPDLFSLNGVDVLMMSSMQFYPPKEEYRFQNLHPSVYRVGRYDEAACRFQPQGDYQELDSGFDFYAPQTLSMPDGRTILIAWKQMWKRTIPESKYGRAGAMTFPRELTLRDGVILQAPARELNAYRTSASKHENVSITNATQLPGVAGNCVDLELTADLSRAKRFIISLFKGKTHETVLSFDVERSVCSLDRSSSGVAITASEEDNVSVRRAVFEKADPLEIRILLDKSSVEVFLNGGKTVMTANVYPDKDDTAIVFSAEGETILREAFCYQISVE